jgi:hypothetical protein
LGTLLRLVFDTAALRSELERRALARIIVKWSPCAKSNCYPEGGFGVPKGVLLDGFRIFGFLFFAVVRFGSWIAR